MYSLWLICGDDDDLCTGYNIYLYEYLIHLLSSSTTNANYIGKKRIKWQEIFIHDSPNNFNLLYCI